MKKRILSLVLALLMLVSVLAGCAKDGASTDSQSPSAPAGSGDNAGGTQPAGSTGGGEEEEITLRWVNGGWSQNDKDKKILERWYEIHPNIKIEVIELSNIVDEAYMANLDTMIGGGEQVDITYLTYEDVYNRIINGGILPLDDYIAAAGDDYEAMYGSLASTLLQYEGHIYGVPFMGNTFKVIYNKTLADQAGVTIEDDWTIADFTEAARKMSDPANGVYGCVIPFTWDGVLYAPAERCGWQSVKKTDDGTVVPNFNDELLTKTLAWEKGLADEGLCPDLATMEAESIARRQVLAEGKCGMIMDTCWALIWLQTYMFNDPGKGELGFELGIADLPLVSDAGKEVSWSNLAGAFYVPKTAKYPAEAYEFAKFICNECVEESANYMPVYLDANMEDATVALTEFTDQDGELHTEIYPLETALAAIATPYESHIGRFSYDPTLSVHTSLMQVLFREQYKLYMNGEIELEEWVDTMQMLGEGELARVQ